MPNVLQGVNETGKKVLLRSYWKGKNFLFVLSALAVCSIFYGLMLLIGGVLIYREWFIGVACPLFFVWIIGGGWFFNWSNSHSTSSTPHTDTLGRLIASIILSVLVPVLLCEFIVIFFNDKKGLIAALIVGGLGHYIAAAVGTPTIFEIVPYPQNSKQQAGTQVEEVADVPLNPGLPPPPSD